MKVGSSSSWMWMLSRGDQEERIPAAGQSYQDLWVVDIVYRLSRCE